MFISDVVSFNGQTWMLSCVLTLQCKLFIFINLLILFCCFLTPTLSYLVNLSQFFFAVICLFLYLKKHHYCAKLVRNKVCLPLNASCSKLE